MLIYMIAAVARPFRVILAAQCSHQVRTTPAGDMDPEIS